LYKMSKILEILYDIALIENPDWLVLCASDELLESGLWSKITHKWGDSIFIDNQ